MESGRTTAQAARQELDRLNIELLKSRAKATGAEGELALTSSILAYGRWRAAAVAAEDAAKARESAAKSRACEPVGRTDPFNRVFAVCWVGGLNINEEFVRSGFGLARPPETTCYVAAQEAAMAEGIGLWQSQFQHPAAYRAEYGNDDRP